MLNPKYIDKYKHIKQNIYNYDGGDSLSFAGQYFVAVYWQYKTGAITDKQYKYEVKSYKKRIKDLYFGYGIFLRHFKYIEWATRWNRMSRDQMTANIYALALVGLWKELFMLILFTIFRFGFTTNIYRNGLDVKDEKLTNIKIPDICGPSIWAMFGRSLILKNKLFLLTYPIILIGDIELLLNALLIRFYKVKKDPTDTNETNFIISLLQSKDICSTFISRLARKIYRKRPIAPKGLLENVSDFGPQSAIDYFFAGSETLISIPDLQPEIHNEYRPFLKDIL